MTKLVFRATLTATDPETHPVLIVGQARHLNQLAFAQVRPKLAPRVSEATFRAALAGLHPAPTDECPLHLNRATVAALPVACSRHNAPARGHALARLVQAHRAGAPAESVVVVCERADVFASGCAVARAFPEFCRKTAAAGGDALVSVEFLVVDEQRDVEKELEVLEFATVGIRLAARIVDTPCNEMNVEHFIAEIERVGEAVGLQPVVIRGEELKRRGFGGIYGVGKAASVGPALAVLSYMPEGAHTTIAWVGKGIVYDTGGLSIKGKTGMPGMKRDCGGAAAILGAFYAAVKSNFTENLHAVFCLAENAVGPEATRPDDIHTLYSGRTVEINNTDAEGRLVLADGVAYAKKDLKANVILDMATLTGAQGVATGKHHAAVLTNRGAWERYAMEAGLISGDLVFPIPYCPELHFFSEFSSAVADMKNSVGDRSNAQSSCAGLFIGAHLGFDYTGTWVHVDMAAPVHSGERATGYGVALLTTLFGQYTNQPLLKSIAPDLDQSIENNSAKKARKN